MEKPFEKVWTNCLAIIKDIVEWQHFKTWFEPIKPVALKDNVLTIQVTSQFFLRVHRRALYQSSRQDIEEGVGQGSKIGVPHHG